MPLRRFSANYIIPIVGSPIRNGVVGVDGSGTIVEIVDHGEQVRELAHTEFHNGIIVPGFVNTHCHTELSHMKGRTRQGGGMPQFLFDMFTQREEAEGVVELAAQRALNSMYAEGISAIGDICNTSHSFGPKQNSRVLSHIFIEVLGLKPQASQKIIDRANSLAQRAIDLGLNPCSITPHSTYSLSEALWQQAESIFNGQELLSIHFAESQEDVSFSITGKGSLAEVFGQMNLPTEAAPRNMPSDILFQFVGSNQKLILVHNTYLDSEQLRRIAEHYSNIFFCFCPQSNLFIEGRLPNFSIFKNLNHQLTIGTDSYASSETLSMLHQIRLINENSLEFDFNQVLTWATLNGAEALGFDKQLGSIEMDKKPGLVLIAPFDFENWRLLPTSKARRLV